MIEKVNLRDQVLHYLQQELVHGRIRHGDRLSLASMERVLQVSVTPVREALTQLERTGVVLAIPNRGFFLAPNTVEDAREIYPVIANLEVMAVEGSTFTAADIRRLRGLRTAFKRAKDPAAAVRADQNLHDALIGNFENTCAKRLIADLKLRVFSYELQYMVDGHKTSTSDKAHGEIIDLLAAGERRKAANRLKAHWKKSLELTVKMLSELRKSTSQ